jgi:hypothetical protein
VGNVIELCRKQMASKYLPISTKNKLGTQFVKIGKSNNGKIFFDPRAGRDIYIYSNEYPIIE